MKRLNNDIAAYPESLHFAGEGILHKKINKWTRILVHTDIIIATWQQSWFAPPSPNYKLPQSFIASCIYCLVFAPWNVLERNDTTAFIFSTKHIIR